MPFFIPSRKNHLTCLEECDLPIWPPLYPNPRSWTRLGQNVSYQRPRARHTLRHCPNWIETSELTFQILLCLEKTVGLIKTLCKSPKAGWCLSLTSIEATVKYIYKEIQDILFHRRKAVLSYSLLWPLLSHQFFCVITSFWLLNNSTLITYFKNNRLLKENNQG